MSQTIWKFPLALLNAQIIVMPEGAEILTVQLQNGQPCLWAIVGVVHAGSYRPDRNANRPKPERAILAMTTTNTSKHDQICTDPACPCHEWNAKSPSESPATPSRDAGFLVPEAENALSGDSAQSSPIPVPDFEHEWESAATGRKRYTEKAEAEHWFMLGAWSGIQFARAQALTEFNEDLREIKRVAGERLTSAIREGR